MEKLHYESIIWLAFAIIISVFAPGYAITTIIGQKIQLSLVPKILFSYLISVLITGAIGYSASLVDLDWQAMPYYVGGVNLLIISGFLANKVWTWRFNKNLSTDIVSYKSIASQGTTYKILVFGALFSLVLFFVYIIYDGKIIGDEWQYHGRALYIMSGSFREVAISGLENEGYPPFSMAFLATFFGISNVPTVNAYASLGFLNFAPVLAYYYFFTKWIPKRYAKAGLLASVLFMLGSGYGWMYALNLGLSSPPSNQSTAIEILYTAGIKTIDIFAPNTFVNVAHPDPSTALSLISLPAGFFILGLLKESTFRNETKRGCLLITMIVILGLLSHDEFGLFVIMISLCPAIFMLKKENYVYLAVIFSLTTIIAISYFLPGQEQYYRERGIYDIPFLILYYIFAGAMWTIYYLRLFERLFHYLSVQTVKLRDTIPSRISRIARFAIPISVTCVFAYLYGMSLAVWYFELPDYESDLRSVPSHMYTLRLGISGLLGIALLLSYLFKKFEKEIFIFGLFALVAYLILPQYFEFRSNRYIMAAFDAFAAIMIYKIILFFKKTDRQTIIINSLMFGSIIIISSLSTILFSGFTALGLDNPDNAFFLRLLPMREFPPPDNLELLNFLKGKIAVENNEEIAYPYSYWLGLNPTIIGFVGIPQSKVSQGSHVIDQSSLEGLYTQLNHTNTKYIVLEKNRIDDLTRPLKFALHNFEKLFENNSYLVLSVPEIDPPERTADVALVNHDIESQTKFVKMVDSKPLMNPDTNIIAENVMRYYDDGSFVLKPLSHVEFNLSETDDDINYIESSFRYLNTNTDADQPTSLIWSDGKRLYAAQPGLSSLIISSTTSNNFTNSSNIVTKVIQTEPTITRDLGTLKVLYGNGMINIFLNDLLRTQIPQVKGGDEISSLGISSGSILSRSSLPLVGKMPLEDSAIRFGKFHSYDYYYGISALGMSGIPYDTFVRSDGSWAAKKYVILPSDTKDLSDYREYIENGGTVMVLGNQGDWDGAFSRLFCLSPSQQTDFDEIMTEDGETLRVKGVASNIMIECNGAEIRSYYLLGGKKVAPFVVEKKIGIGKVIFVNSGGYLDSVFSQPESYFPTLPILTSSLDSHDATLTIDEKNNRIISGAPIPHFYKNASISGEVLVNSSSLNIDRNKIIQYETLSVIENNGTNMSTRVIKDLPLEEIRLFGNYQVSLNTSNIQYNPSIWNYGYIGFVLTNGTDLAVDLGRNSSAKIQFQGGGNNNLKITDSKLIIKDVVGNLPIMLKYPTVSVDGNMTFEDTKSHDPRDTTKLWAEAGDRLIVFDNSTIRFKYVNSYNSNATLLYTSFFDWISVNAEEAEAENKESLLVRSTAAEWDRVITSYYGTRILVPIIIIGILSFYLVYTSPKLRRWIDTDHK